MTTAGFWARAAREVVRVSGPDARSYLQSQLSQDVSRLEPRSSTWSFILQPTGKVTALVRVTLVADDALLLDVDAGTAPDVVARLERFRIRVKAELEPLDWSVVAVRGVADAATPPLAGAFVAPAWWGPDCGYDVLALEPSPPAGVPAGDPVQLEAARVAAGWPAMGAEITDQTIPGELGPLLGLAVSFTKGCYPGQELVERMDSRGATAPRLLRRLRSADSTPLTAGVAVTADGREVGHVTSAAGGAALALIARAVEPATAVTVAGVAATVLDLRSRGVS